MNRALLSELQRQRAYPSVTLLFNTSPNTTLSPSELDTAIRLACHADHRLEGDVSDQLRTALVTQLHDLVHQQVGERSGRALALCVSPHYAAAVRLGRAVEERVVIDDTFATRDLVADMNRTAQYRVVTISERSIRVLVGDRQRLAEQRDDTWPLTRRAEHTPTTWMNEVTEQLRDEHARYPLPTVVGGVQRSIRQMLAPDLFDTIGLIPGNHDRSSWVELHNLAWPLVTDWLRTDQRRAMGQLDQALSAGRYAGGIHEVWPLANDGRIATLVVEEHYALPARLDANHQLHPADDRDHPEVIDDIVDETIEAVLRNGGTTVLVNDDTLEAHQRIAAILRY
jgi:Bacterial archaeo-eukaryotic release factor family 3